MCSNSWLELLIVLTMIRLLFAVKCYLKVQNMNFPCQILKMMKNSILQVIHPFPRHEAAEGLLIACVHKPDTEDIRCN